MRPDQHRQQRALLHMGEEDISPEFRSNPGFLSLVQAIVPHVLPISSRAVAIHQEHCVFWICKFPKWGTFHFLLNTQKLESFQLQGASPPKIPITTWQGLRPHTIGFGSAIPKGRQSNPSWSVLVWMLSDRDISLSTLWKIYSKMLIVVS